MKKILFGTAIIFVFVTSAFGQKAAAGKADPAAGVRAAFDRLIEGVKQVDAVKVMSVYEKSDRLLIFNNNGTATSGWDNVKANVAATYAKTRNVMVDITGLRVEMLGPKDAYVTCKWKQTQEFNGKLEDSSGRMTLVFKLINKDWKIIHRHTSPDKPDAIRIPPSEREN